MTTDYDSLMVDLADAESLLGMLQRGRGKGYLLALQTPPEKVWPLLFECITNDPRVDSQCEYRGEYYAGLIRATYMDLEPLRSHLKAAEDGDGDTALVIDTLVILAREWQDNHALDILEEYVSYGEAWDWILHDLACDNSSEAVAGAIEVLCDRVSSDWNFRSDVSQVVEEEWEQYRSFDQEARSRCRMFLPICEPWKTICQTNERLAALFDEVGIAYDQPGPPRETPSGPNPATLSLEDLFSQVNKSNRFAFRRAIPEKVSVAHEDYLLEQLSSDDPLRVVLALKGLGALGTRRAFEAVRSWIEASENADSTVRAKAFDAFSEMPGALTLDIARQWFRREEWYLQAAAGGVLENHATVEDIPLLTEVLRLPGIANREDWRLPSALEAFKLLKGIGRVPELENAFCCAGVSYDRHRAAEAMYATAPDHFVNQYAFECLWDCHWDTRALGGQAVDLSTPGVLSRLRELATNPHESQTVREAAQARLDEVAGKARV